MVYIYCIYSAFFFGKQTRSVERQEYKYVCVKNIKLPVQVSKFYLFTLRNDYR